MAVETGTTGSLILLPITFSTAPLFAVELALADTTSPTPKTNLRTLAAASPGMHGLQVPGTTGETALVSPALAIA